MPRDAYQETGVLCRSILLIYIGLSTVVLAYFATGVFGVDVYNHITRLTIECAAPGDPLLDMWQVRFGLIPNLALDLVNLPFCGLVPVEPLLAGIIAATLAALFAGAWHLQHIILGRVDWTILLVPALSFNIVTYMGYVSYLIGGALFLLFAAYLLRKPFAERRFGPLAVTSNLAGLLLCLCHAFAAMAGGVLLFLWMLGDTKLRDWWAVARTALRSAACYIAPVAFVLMADKGTTDISYTLQSKSRSLFSAFSYGPTWLTLAIAFTWCALAYAALCEKRIALALPMQRLLLGMLLFLLVIPTQIGAAVDIDSRTALLLVLLLVVSLRVVQPTRSVTLAIVGLSAITIAAQLAVALPARAALHRQVAEVRAGAAKLPPHATLFSTTGEDEGGMLHYHMASVATVAAAAFNPLEFSGKGMQPLDATPAFACRNVEVGRPLTRREAMLILEPGFFERELSPVQQHTFGYARHWTIDYSHLLYMHEGKTGPTPWAGYPVVASGSFFTIYKVPGVPVPGDRGPCAPGR